MMTTASADRVTVPAAPTVDLDPARVLAVAEECVFTQARAEADLLEAAARWADLNPVTEDSPCPADWWDGEGVPVHSVIPDVAAPAIVEFAAVVGRSTSAGKWLIFEALQLRHRMPRTWQLLRQCRMPAQRARQLVMGCYRLNDASVDWLDRQMATVTGRVSPAQLDRMIARAASEHDPEFVAEQRRKRYVHVEHGDPNAGIDSAGVRAVLDPWDAVDLDAALNVGAEARKQWGSTQDRDGRRAEALGDLARTRLGQAVLPLEPDRPIEPDQPTEPDQPSDWVPPLVSRPRELSMYLHLSDQAVDAGPSSGAEDGRVWLAECGTIRQTITAELVRQWCGNPDLTVIITPVIDLRAPIITDTYRPSPRQREHVALTDDTCAFAHCTRPLHPVPTRRRPDGTLDESWDADHTRAWQPGDQTSTDGLVGLCRHHHRGKTLHGWWYRQITPGTVLWRSPYGHDYLRTSVGTTNLGHHSTGNTRGRHLGRTPSQVPGWLEPGPQRPPDHDEEPPPDPLDDDIRPEDQHSDDGQRSDRPPGRRRRSGHVQDRLLDDTG